MIAELQHKDEEKMLSEQGVAPSGADRAVNAPQPAEPYVSNAPPIRRGVR